MNKVFLFGRLGRDPEERYTASGKCVANFSMATSTYKKKDGQWKENTEWHRVVAWEKQAEKVLLAKKGDPIFVEGSLRSRKWEDKDGNKHNVTEIWAKEIVCAKIYADIQAQEQEKQSQEDDDIPF